VVCPGPAALPGIDVSVYQGNIVMINKMGPLGPGDLPPTLDMELTGGQSPATITAHVHTWMDKVQAATGRVPMTGSGNDTVTSSGSDSAGSGLAGSGGGNAADPGQSSGCATAPGSTGSRAAGLGLAMMGLAMAARRRRG